MAKRTVHVTFLVLLSFLVLTTAYLYIATDLMTANPARILGASVSQLALWLIAYLICLGRPSAPLVVLGGLAVVLGRLVMPVVGWGVLVAMFFVRWISARA